MLERINTNKATGPDKEPLNNLKVARENPREMVKFKQKLKKQLVQEKIWHMRIVPLKKEQVYDQNKGNFRPIAIMNGSAKAVELVVLHELEALEYEYQHGFTKGKSIVTAHHKYWDLRD